MTFTKKYCWRLDAGGGVFTQPKEIGPYYDPTFLQEDYDSEEEALNDLKRYCEELTFGSDDYFLMTFYEVSNDT